MISYVCVPRTHMDMIIDKVNGLDIALCFVNSYGLKYTRSRQDRIHQQIPFQTHLEVSNQCSGFLVN